MNPDIRSLCASSRLAYLSAEKAVGPLVTFTGTDTYINVTKVGLGTKSNAENEFAKRDLMNVHIGSSGGLNDHTVLVLSPEPAKRLVDVLVPSIDTVGTGGELAESSLKEVASIMLGGLIDDRIDYPDTTADVTTSTYIDDENDGPLDRIDVEGLEDGSGDEHVLVSHSRLKAMDNIIEFDLYMMPAASSIGTIIEASGDDDALPVESFATFSEMISNGATQASEDITAVTGISATVEASRLSLAPIEDVPMSLTDAVRRGTILEFNGTLSGYVVVLFGGLLTENIASNFLPGMEGDEAMRQSVIQEIGNIATSGFLDDWTSVFEMTIGISPPRHVHGIGLAAIDPLATDLAQSRGYAFLVGSAIRANDDEFICDIYTFPDGTEPCRALERLSPTA